ncbi:MAG: TraR/DksA C4-type zinc finger protein [Sedimentisphaerales bacterium]|nr:TraR/DksA C4-type zinc finger protein [Sedimentisphaerales bacterium]
MAKKTKKTTKKKTTAKKKVVKTVNKKTRATAERTPKKMSSKKNIRKKAESKPVEKGPVKRRMQQKVQAPLTPAEIEHFRQLLLEKRMELIGDVNSIESEALKTSRLDAAGDLSSMPIHMADIGTDNFEQEFALGLMSSERKILQEIHAALHRIDNGTYGVCEGTGQQIGKLRLEAIPWARYCLDYARMVEQGIVMEGEKAPGYLKWHSDEEEEEEEYDEDLEFIHVGEIEEDAPEHEEHEEQEDQEEPEEPEEVEPVEDSGDGFDFVDEDDEGD